jgi:hypothetical protein
MTNHGKSIPARSAIVPQFHPSAFRLTHPPRCPTPPYPAVTPQFLLDLPSPPPL